MRVVCRSRREAVERAGWRDGDGELRHRAGQGRHAPIDVSVDELVEQVAAAGYAAHPRQRGGSRTSRPWHCSHSLAHAVADLRAVVDTGRADVDDPGAAVRWLAMAGADAGDTGRDVGSVAVPRRCMAQPAPRHSDDGHAHLARRARRLRMVAVLAVAWRCDGHLPRGRRRRDDAHPPRSLPRGSRQAACRARRCAPCSSSGPRTSPCSATVGRSASRSTSSQWATSSSSGRARRSPLTVSSRTDRRRSTRRC